MVYVPHFNMVYVPPWLLYTPTIGMIYVSPMAAGHRNFADLREQWEAMRRTGEVEA